MADAEPMGQVVLFSVGSETYAMGINRMVEIANARQIQPPTSPPVASCAVGEVLSRGTRVPVVDLRRLFGHHATRWAPDQPVVVMAPSRQGPVGFLVDRVHEIQPSGGTLRPLPPRIIPQGHNLYRGVLQRPGQMLLVLDEARVLDVAVALESHA